MALKKIELRPGVYREGTQYSNQGGWYDCNKIRFRSGLPEKMKGWIKNSTTQLTGICRALIAWSTLFGQNYVGLGTTSKYYVQKSSGGNYIDITPIRRTVTLGANSMACTNLLKTVVITDNANEASAGDYVTITGATTFGGIPAADLNKEQLITETTLNTITITVATAATSTTTGGGTPTLAYQISTGLDTVVTGDGWGAGPYSRDTWGSSYGDITVSQQLRLWSHDTYGEDLIMCVRDGGIYFESQADIETSTVDVPVRAKSFAQINALLPVPYTGPNVPPVVSREIAVAGARNVIAFACNPYGDTVQDGLLIRWSASEDPTDWQPRTDNDAGDLRIPTGSQIITQIHTKLQIVVWTELSMFALTYTGPPDTFGLEQIGYGTSIIAPNAKAAVDDVVYWMGNTTFYVYNGKITQLPCTVKDYVFTNMNMSQAGKITCGTNLALGEVIWFYPSTSSTEPDSYVTYNYINDIWYYGTLGRSAWLDFASDGLPIATGLDSYLYNHEVGYDDGSTNPPAPIEAYITSSPFEIGDGDSMMFVRQIYPDLTFRDSSAATPSATFTLTAYNYPGSGPTQPDTAPVSAVTSNITQFTEQVSLRMRGRSATMKISSVDLGVAWRLGVPRFEMRTDGRR
jgi:hypothetical protein